MVIRTAAAVDRLARISTSTPKVLREQVLGEIRRVLPFDAHVWLLTDPVTRVGTSPLAAVPGLPWDRLPAYIRWRYLTRLNRWTDLIDADTPVALLHERTAGDLTASLFWREAQRELAVVDTASVVFADRFGCWGWLELSRYSPASTFTSADAVFLAAVADTVTRGLRQAQARTFVVDSTGPALDGPSVLVLGSDLRVRLRTSAATEALFRLNPPDDPVPAIPAAAYNVAAALIAEEQGIPVGPPWSRVHLGSGQWVTLRAARIAAADGGEADIAVSIEAATPAERLEVFALAHGLSRRERQVLAELTTGADTHVLARRLVISEHTVNDHVKAVLAKTGSAGRQVLLSRVAGTA